MTGRRMHGSSAGSSTTVSNASSPRISVLIVDDEASARAGVRALLEQQADVHVVAECASAVEALTAIRRHQPDLVFLDVELAGSSGISILEGMQGPGKPRPVIVFVTAFDSYAIRAFEHAAVDYLLKPYTDQRFSEALDRARRTLRASAHEAFHAQVAALAMSVPKAVEPAEVSENATAVGVETPFLTRLAVRSGNRLKLIMTDDVDWIEADGDYVRIHSNGKSLLHRITMSRLEQRLDPARFIRVHRSTIVRLDAVTELRHEASDATMVVLADGVCRPVSETGKTRLLGALGR